MRMKIAGASWKKRAADDPSMKGAVLFMVATIDVKDLGHRLSTGAEN